MTFSSKTTHHFCLSSVAALVLLLGTLGAQAFLIDVPNYSFELPNSPAATSTNPNVIPYWVFNVQGGSYYGSMAISSNFSSPGTSDGNDYAFINNDAVNVTDTLTSAQSLGPILPGMQYTLTVAIGNRNGSGIYDDPGNVTLSLLANGQAFATETVPNGSVPNGTFEDFSLTYTTTSSSPIVGDNLEIQLGTQPITSGEYQPAFDNVRLDLEEVPEPQTCAMITLGALALGWMVWRLRDLHNTELS